MPCTKCRTEFNLLTWKLKCPECGFSFCTKCLHKQNGYYFCEKCATLNKRPPDRDKLMELRVKDLQQYLNKYNVSTHGLVEKSELVEMFYRRPIPIRQKKGHKLSSVLGGSVPNLAANSQEHLKNLKTNVKSYVETGYNFLGRSMEPSSSSQSATSSPQTRPNQTPNVASNNVNIPPQNEDTAPLGNTPLAQEKRTKYPKLSDFEQVEDLNDLSVKQLKELLLLNRVDFRGCVEKTELLEKATRLWVDHYQNRVLVTETSEDLCKICMDAPLSCVILECGHMATCVDCGKQLAECPICRQYVTRVVRTFKA